VSHLLHKLLCWVASDVRYRLVFVVLSANAVYRVWGEFDEDEAAVESSRATPTRCSAGSIAAAGKSERFSIYERTLQEVI